MPTHLAAGLSVNRSQQTVDLMMHQQAKHCWNIQDQVALLKMTALPCKDAISRDWNSSWFHVEIVFALSLFQCVAMSVWLSFEFLWELRVEHICQAFRRPSGNGPASIFARTGNLV